MRRTLSAALLLLPALASPVSTQMQPSVTPDVAPQGQALAKAAIVRCGQLIALILSSREPMGVTVQQAHEWEEQHDVEKCTEAAQRVLQASGGSAR